MKTRISESGDDQWPLPVHYSTSEHQSEEHKEHRLQNLFKSLALSSSPSIVGLCYCPIHPTSSHFPPKKGQINSKVPHFNFLAVDYLAQPVIIVLSKSTINPASPCVETWRPLQTVWEKPGASRSISAVCLLCSSRKRIHTLHLLL